MIRHLKILEYAISSLWRRKYKNLAIILVYTFTIAVLASILFLTHALKTEVSMLLSAAPELIVQKLAAGRHDLISVDYATRIQQLPGVTAAQPRFWGYYYDALTEANYTLQETSSGQSQLNLLRGQLPTEPGECAIGAGVAQLRRIDLGDDLIMVDSSNTGIVLEVAGVFNAQSDLLTNDLVVLGREDLIEFFGYSPELATDIAVRVSNPREVGTIAEKIKRQWPDTRPISRSEILRTYDAVFNWRSGMMLSVFAAALVAFCILAWDKATGVSVEEKREIGILKAIGWETSDILELKFWEGLAISLLSLLLGLLAAYVHVFILGAKLLTPVIKGWSTLFPPFHLIPFIDPYQILVISLLTVPPYVVSTLVPSWKAAITDPESAMRG
jgi:lipoprotein-releasing system permease protein